MPAQKRKASDTAAAEAAEARKQEVMARIGSLNKNDAKNYLYEMCDNWKMQANDAPFSTVVATAFENFGLSVDGDLDIEHGCDFGFSQLDAAIHTKEMEAITLYYRLRTLEVFDGDGDGGDGGDGDGGEGGEGGEGSEGGEGGEGATGGQMLQRSIKLLEMVWYAKKIVLSTVQAKLAIHQANSEGVNIDPDTADRLESWALRFHWIDTNINEGQEVILYLLDSAFEKRLRKQDGYVFEPIMVDDRYNSHAYRRTMEVREWVLSVCQKEMQFRQWTNLLHGTGTLKFVVEYLSGCKDYQFPDLRKRRDVFAFRNGVYVAGSCKFYEYTNPAEVLDDSVVACKYFDLQFTDYPEIRNWQHIETPFLQSILDYQGIPQDACEWLYIFLGRMLYDLNEHDGWQVCPMIKGYAGTGKSTICTNVIRNFYDAIDVGVLSNNVEKQFGISAFYDKYLFIGPEVRNDLKIEQAEFQSIVSGEDVQVSVKHKKAFSVRWRVPGWLAGNEVPTWADAAGSIQRRLPIFDFPRPVLHGDMRLGEKLEEELPDIIAKCNRAYRDMAERHGGENVWTLLPPYFTNTSNELAQTINVLEAFMTSDEVVYGSDKYCPFAEFKNALSAYAVSNNFPRPRFNADFFRGPFTRKNITRTKDRRVYNGREQQTEFLVGLDVVTQDGLAGGFGGGGGAFAGNALG